MASRDSNRSDRRFDEDVQQNEHNTCPECSGRVTTNTHETVCNQCGLVVDDQRIDRGPEWRNFDDERGDRRRTGAPNTVSRHDRGIGSQIGWGRDATGGTIGSRKRRQLGRLRKRHKRASIGSKAEQNRIRAFIDIRRMVAALRLSRSDRDQACQLFRTAQNEGLLRGRGIEAIASACLYVVCRVNECPRSFEEVAAVSRVSQRKVSNGYMVLNRELGLPIPPAKARQYLPELASAVDAPPDTERRAKELLEDAERAVADGVSPIGAAAGALYLAGRETGEFVTQDEVAEAAAVSTVTVRERYRDLESVMVG